jgi:hypothetical protein
MIRKLALTVAALGVAMAALAACNEGSTRTAGRSTPPPPTTKTHTEAEWTIVTPAAWTSADITATADAKKAVRYSDANGNYFIVAIDPTGSDFAADTVWQYKVIGSRFRVTAKTPCVSTEGSGCSTDDARFDGYLMWKTGTTPLKVGGHTWYFIFGNTKTKSVTLRTYEQIAESIRVTV